MSDRYNRRAILRAAIGSACLGTSVNTATARNNTTGKEDVILIERVTANNGRNEAFVRSDDDMINLVIQRGGRERIVETGEKAPMHLAWNDQGNRLVFSLEGEISMCRPNGDIWKLTSGGNDVLPQFKDGDIVFFRDDEAKRIPANGVAREQEDNPSGVQSTGSTPLAETEFDLTYITEHPAVEKEAVEQATKRSVSGKDPV